MLLNIYINITYHVYYIIFLCSQFSVIYPCCQISGDQFFVYENYILCAIKKSTERRLIISRENDLLMATFIKEVQNTYIRR